MESTVTPIVFLDFDGTITRRDATDAILEAFADPHWLRIEEAWKMGQIGSRECLSSQMALVRATPEQLDSLLDGIEIDDGFGLLLDTCSAHAVPVHIVSDGFDYCIQRILFRASLHLAQSLASVRITSSHLQPDGNRWTVDFPFLAQPCGHGCGTCKLAAMERLNTADGPLIFIGDGLSDKYAATSADLLFAKDALAAYCAERGIAYTFYDGLAAVAQRLDRLFESNRAAQTAIAPK